MHRFVIPEEWLTDDRIVIAGDQAHQIRNVLRLKPGDTFTVLDNTGCEYQAAVVEIQKERVKCRVIEKSISGAEPVTEIVVYQSLLKGNRVEYVLQKCTELGVSRFVPLITERCIARAPSINRLSRWEKIITEATEQCGRRRKPELQPLMDFPSACKEAQGSSLLPWESEDTLGIKLALHRTGKTSRVNIFVGPEGGFTFSEVNSARDKGIMPVSLGKRVLRADTASIIATAIILYEMDELSL